MRRRIRRLSSQIFLAQLLILTVSLAVAFVLFAQTTRDNLDHEYQTRASDIAQTFAESPSVRGCIPTGPPACPADVQSLA
ncbi:MAG TPA: hypothetical protein VFQ74_07850, partial [Pseudolysinimonas sp.]|nr:hypothetical protein [Pseudolysinimonas sp.]